jgi:hypothetical protein
MRPSNYLLGFLTLLLLFYLVADAQTPQQPSETLKFAEFYSSTSPIEMMKQLDNLAELLRKEPRARVWLLDYEGTILPGAATRLSFTVENYLSRKEGLQDYLLTRAGARCQGESKVELWYVPPGGLLPHPSNETVPRDYRFAFKWDELYYLLQDEKALLKGTESETLDSNYYNDHNTFLDSFRSQLVLPQAGRGRIVIYPKRGDPSDLPQRLADYERRYLFRKHGIDSSKISLEVGEPRERRKVELWIVPQADPLLMSEFAPTDAATIEGELARVVQELRALKGVQGDGKIYVIAYTGAFIGSAQVSKREVTAQVLLEGVRKSVTRKYGVEADRIVTIDGGKQKEVGVELWIVPPGAAEPAPKLTEP